MSTEMPFVDESSGNSTLALRSVHSGMLSAEMYQKLLYVIAGLPIIIGTLGTAGNIMTIIVYTKMGFAESTTISLTALAISDLGIVIYGFATGFFYFVPISVLHPFSPEVALTLVAYPHYALTRVSAMITTFLSIERYLCVFWPLKIKSIITSRRTVKIMIFFFAVSILPMLVVYFRYPIGWEYFPEYDRVLLGLLPHEEPISVMGFLIFQVYSSTVLPITTFVTVTIFTILLTISLSKSRKWRDLNRATASATRTEQISASANSTNKETKAVKMVVVIATVFIVSSIPSCVHLVVVIIIPEFDIVGPYSDVFVLTGLLFFAINCMNCTANIIIYFNMSTKFRLAFLDLFSRRKNHQQQVDRV